jgi:hypothetical protein
VKRVVVEARQHAPPVGKSAASTATQGEAFAVNSWWQLLLRGSCSV